MNINPKNKDALSDNLLIGDNSSPANPDGYNGSPLAASQMALQSLVERYGAIAGYPDGTFRGNRAMTRYEFAAGLNSQQSLAQARAGIKSGCCLGEIA